MKTALILSALALSAAVTVRPALAAHAGAPYKNVDKRNDAGNDTGDSQVDQLNSAQLNQNYYANQQNGAPMPMPAPAPAR